MTHQNQSNEVAAVVQLLADEGFEGMAHAMQILLNEAMKLERAGKCGDTFRKSGREVGGSSC